MKKIIGLDLGKYNSTACVLLDGGEVGFQTLPTTAERLRDFFQARAARLDRL